MQTKISVLINLYNYGRYIGDAIDSVLAQTVQADEIIIVDDGSTDNGPEEVEARAKKHPHLRLIRKQNGGQLSCFQKGLEKSSGEILFLLDADDTWEPSHIASFIEVFQAHPEVDLVFTGYRKFGHSTTAHSPYSQSLHLGQNVLGTLFSRYYFGSITSANAVKRKALNELFPAPDDLKERCRINADAWVVFGLSMYGGISYYLDGNTVNYRIHGDNQYHLKKHDKTARFTEIINQRRIIEYFRAAANIPYELRFDFHREFESIPKPDRRSYDKALNTLQKLQLPLRLHFKMRMRLAAHYRRNREVRGARVR